MDAIFSWFQDFFQAIFVKSAIARFEWLDWLTGVFILVGVVYGMRKGLMREIVEILEMILIVVLVLIYHKPLLHIFDVYLSFIPHVSAPAVSFILLGGAVWGVVAFLDGHVRKWIQAQVPPILKAGGGALLGAVHFLLIWSFISQGILLLPVAKLRRSYDSGHSYSGPLIQKLAPKILKIVETPFTLVPSTP